MPALSSPSTWRKHPQFGDGYLYLHIPDVVFERSINQTAFSYPVTELTYDNPSANPGAYTDVKVGQTVKFYDSTKATVKGFARVKQAPSTTSLYISVQSQGEIQFADNDVFEVLDDFRLWSKVPFIDSNGSVYKDWNIPYTSQNTNIPPVANAGAWYAGLIDSVTSLITVTFDGTNSFAMVGSIASYLWDVGDGTITVGTSSSSTITATFPQGYRWISLTVTDTNSQSHTAYALIVGGNAAYYYRSQITQLNGDVQTGWNAAFNLLKDDVSDFPEGTPVIYFEDETFGSSAGSLNGQSGREQVKFAGYQATIPHDISGLDNTITITATGLKGVMALKPAFAQVTERSSVVPWYQIPSLTWWQYVIYLLRWHTTALEITDIEKPSFDYDVVGLDADPGTIASQLDYAGSAIWGYFTCDRNSILYFRRFPQLMTTAEKAALTTTVTLADSDWTNIRFTETLYDDIASNYAGAIGESTTDIIAFAALSPGRAPGQGAAQDTQNRLLVADQSELNERSGNYFSWRNNDIKDVNIDILNRGMIADPAWQEWIILPLSATTNKRQTAFNGTQQFVLKNINVSHNHQIGVASETWQMEKAITGVSSITIQLPGADPPATGDYIASDGTLESIPTISIPPIDAISPSDIGSGDNPVVLNTAVIAWTGNRLGRSSNYTNASPSWATIFDNSDTITNVFNHPEQQQKVWILTNNGLFHTTNVLASTVSWAQYNATVGFMGRSLQSDSNKVLWHVDGALNPIGDIYYSTDAGQNITSTLSIPNGSSATGFDSDDYNLGVSVVSAGGGASTMPFTTAYTDVSPTYLPGLTGIGPGKPGMQAIRVPYFEIDGQGANNSVTNFNFIWSKIDNADTMWKVYANLSGNSVNSETDISPIINGTYYGARYFTALETSGANSQYILSCVSKGDAEYRLIRSINGGTDWDDLGLKNIIGIHFVVGSTTNCWMAGEDGIFYSSDTASTLLDKIGDYYSTVDNNTIWGVLQIDT